MTKSDWLALIRASKAEGVSKHAEDKAKRLVEWSAHPLAWLFGTDLDGRPLIWTSDELDSVNPTKPYPDKEYLRFLIEILHTEKFVLIEKCRQMIVSTTTLLYMDWECRFIESRRWILSKRTEQESKDMLRDKLRAVHLRLPVWVQAILPLKAKPAGKLIYPHSAGLGDSYILGANEAMAVGQARGGTASGVAVDEAAYQEDFKGIVAASLPMTQRLVAITTPALGFSGGIEFKRMIDEAKGQAYQHLMEGLSVKKSPSDFLIVTLRHTADEAKRDPAFLEAVERKMGPKDFRREMMLDWTSPSGSAYYAEYQTNGGNDIYVRRSPGLFGKPATILRGWDFGVRRPACLAKGHKVLLSDLRWVPVESLREGDSLFSCEERSEGPGPGRHRRWEAGTVTSVQTTTKPCIRLTLSNGDQIVCSTDHRILAPLRDRTGHRSKRNSWRLVIDLKVGDRVPRYFQPWPQPNTYDQGWVSGFYDGEGSIIRGNAGQLTLQLSQCENGLMDKLQQILDGHGFSTYRNINTATRKNHNDVEKIHVHGGWAGTLRFLGMYRPQRLLRNYSRFLRQHEWHMRKESVATVVSIEPAGEQIVYVLETSTHTYIADGYAHHNCVWAQYDPFKKRLYVLRELMPGFWDSSTHSDYGIDIRSFRDSVLFLSGQSDATHLSPAALDLVNHVAEASEYAVPPWFGLSHSNTPVKFVDFALGIEVNRRMETEEQLLTYAMILAESGIYINEANENWDVREGVMRDLLTIRDDGYPGLILDPYCAILITGFNGGIQYAKKTKMNPLPETAARDGYFEHLHDALNYVSVSMLPAVVHRESRPVPMAFLRGNERIEVPSDGVEFWIGGR